MRRRVVDCAGALHFGETAAGRAALVATELATNIVKHAGSGTIVIGSDAESSRKLILVAMDKGRGIDNPGRAMQDGYSTAGSPGTGLGAIRRASRSMHLFSTNRGTVVCCEMEDEEGTIRKNAEASHMDVAGICIAMAGESESGDSWTAVQNDGAVTIGVADGLGHGSAAATASCAFVGVLTERAAMPIEEIFARAHVALRPTRGAAVGVARVVAGESRADFAGVGNIAATIVADDRARKVVSHAGIVGHEMRKVQTFTYPWTAASLLVMQSDGVGSGWNLDDYPGLTQQPAVVIAAVLYRDYCRGRDDATVVVARAHGAAA